MYQRDFHRNPPQNKQVLDRMQLRMKIMENATSSENNGRVLCQKRFIQLFRWLCVRFAPLLSLFDLHSSLKPWMLGSDRKPSEISYFRKYQVAPCHFQPELIYSQRIWTSTEGILAVRPTLIQEKWSISDNRPFSFNHSFTYTLSVPCSVSNLSERDECTHLTQMINLLFQKFFILFALFPKGNHFWSVKYPNFSPAAPKSGSGREAAGTRPIWYTYYSTFSNEIRFFQNMQRFVMIPRWTKFGFNLSPEEKEWTSNFDTSRTAYVWTRYEKPLVFHDAYGEHYTGTNRSVPCRLLTPFCFFFRYITSTVTKGGGVRPPPPKLKFEQ